MVVMVMWKQRECDCIQMDNIGRLVKSVKGEYFAQNASVEGR